MSVRDPQFYPPPQREYDREGDLLLGAGALASLFGASPSAAFAPFLGHSQGIEARDARDEAGRAQRFKEMQALSSIEDRGRGLDLREEGLGLREQQMTDRNDQFRKRELGRLAGRIGKKISDPSFISGTPDQRAVLLQEDMSDYASVMGVSPEEAEQHFLPYMDLDPTEYQRLAQQIKALPAYSAIGKGDVPEALLLGVLEALPGQFRRGPISKVDELRGGVSVPPQEEDSGFFGDSPIGFGSPVAGPPRPRSYDVADQLRGGDVPQVSSTPSYDDLLTPATRRRMQHIERSDDMTEHGQYLRAEEIKRRDTALGYTKDRDDERRRHNEAMEKQAAANLAWDKARFEKVANDLDLGQRYSLAMRFDEEADGYLKDARELKRGKWVGNALTGEYHTATDDEKKQAANLVEQAKVARQKATALRGGVQVPRSGNGGKVDASTLRGPIGGGPVPGPRKPKAHQKKATRTTASGNRIRVK